MEHTRARRVLMAMTVGGIAGVAFVFNDDWFTQFIGAVLGCVCMFVAYAVFDFCAAWYERSTPSSLRRYQVYRNEYDQDTFRIERIFMDDGKPW